MKNLNFVYVPSLRDILRIASEPEKNERLYAVLDENSWTLILEDPGIKIPDHCRYPRLCFYGQDVVSFDRTNPNAPVVKLFARIDGADEECGPRINLVLTIRKNQLGSAVVK